jgi:mycofactocin glycosyltransferase
VVTGVGVPTGLGAPPADRLPDGFTVSLDRRCRRLVSSDGGTSLLGLSPGRLLHLTAAGARLLGRGDQLTVRDRPSAMLARRLLDAGIAHPVVTPSPSVVDGAPVAARAPVVDGAPVTARAPVVDGAPVTARAPVADRAPAKDAPVEHVPVEHVPVEHVPAEHTPAESAVTVVIPVRDRPDALRRLLVALDVTAPGLAEVIVVDDGSRDVTATETVAEAAGARLVRRVTSAGPASARNTGLAEARTELVAFLDSDVVPQPGWLTPLLQHLADPSVALVAPRIVGLVDSLGAGWLARYETLRSSLDLGREPAPVLPRTRVAYVPSAALLVRRAALGRGFDERMRVAEDVDLVLRLYAAGWRMRYEPLARVAHDHRVRPAQWWARKAFYGTGAAPLALRHPGSVPPMVLAPWAIAVCGLLGTQRRVGLLGAGVVGALAWWRIRGTLGRLRDPGRTSALLVGLGLGSAVEQTAGLLNRHWWPLTALGCLFSRRVRRAAMLAALTEGVLDWYRHRPHPGEPPGLDPLRYLLAHRADDLGYGAGLWWGALRNRTPAALRPLLVRRPAAPH